MDKANSVEQKHRKGLCHMFRDLSPGRKFIIAVFAIWLAQALPKWSLAITADGELSATIMRMFVTPRTERQVSMNCCGAVVLEQRVLS